MSGGTDNADAGSWRVDDAPATGAAASDPRATATAARSSVSPAGVGIAAGESAAALGPASSAGTTKMKSCCPPRVTTCRSRKRARPETGAPSSRVPFVLPRSSRNHEAAAASNAIRACVFDTTLSATTMVFADPRPIVACPPIR